jgi:hypothetical protein
VILVGINQDGVDEYHAPATTAGAYLTLCCMDGNDPTIGQIPTTKPGRKITCPQCWQIWRDVMDMELRSTDFDRKAKS